jgi:hypothetical protein
MPIAEQGPLGPDFERRLRAALDRVAPPTPYVSGARYRMTAARLPRRALRLATLLAAAGAAGVVSLSAFAATGSANPAVWTERAASTIKSVGHIPETPKTDPGQTPPSGQSAPPATRGGTPHSSPAATPKPDQGEHSERDHPERSPHPEPSPSPRPSPSPEPSDDGHGTHSPWPSAWPSPWPSAWPSPWPSPRDH